MQTLVIGVVIFASLASADPVKRRCQPLVEPRSDYVPDIRWVPRPSDEAYAYSGSELGLFAATRFLGIGDYARSIIANDDKGLEQLKQTGDLVVLTTQTKVLVIERYLRPLLAPNSNLLEVRVLEGPHEGKAVFLMEEHVERLLLCPIVGDMSYRHKIGDVVSTIYDETPLTPIWADLDAFEKLRLDGDRVGMEKMIGDGKIQMMNRFFKMEIVNIYAIEKKTTKFGIGKQIIEKSEKADYFASQHAAGFAVELKAPSGVIMYASMRNVGRLVNGPLVSKLEPSILSLDRVKKIERKTTPPSDRSKRELDTADLLVKQGKPEEALKAYRSIVKSYPGTPAADAASARVGRITGRPSTAKLKSDTSKPVN
jgi:hypothetical protein